MKSRTLSGMKPIKPQKCKFDSIDCTPTCKYYKTCVHSLVNQVVAEAERASHDADFKKQLGLRNLSQEEKKFYEGFKDIKQSITANQIDIIPTEIIDRKVTFDEALQLVPPDPTELLEVVEAYQKEVDKIKKKEESKAQMKAFSSR